MEQLYNFLNNFLKSDILKTILLIFPFITGIGGLFYWYEKWSSRRRLEVDNCRETFDLQGRNLRVTLAFRCRNNGDKATSLRTKIKVISYQRRKRTVDYLQLEGNDLKLEPHNSHYFIASGELSANYVFKLYPVYKISHVAGCSTHLYGQSSATVIISRFKWEIGVFRHKYFQYNPRLLKRAAELNVRNDSNG
jgi:hypothetical protein